MKAPQIYFLLILSNFCLSDDFHPEQQRMLAVIYSQTAAEHHVAIKQTYNSDQNKFLVYLDVLIIKS